jgi:predicted MFS family arabinose efflux permease
MASLDRPVSLWRNRDYLLLWSGQTISGVGSSVSTIAYPLLVLMITRSPAQTGFISAARAFTYVIFVLPAGALVDRWNRKLVMVICDTIRLFSLASVAGAIAWGHLSLLQLYITAIVEASSGTLFDIAEISCLPQVVAQEQLPNAMGRVQTTIGIAALLGSALGGLLFTLRSLLPFLADALSYLVSIGSLFFIRTTFQQRKSEMTHHLYQEIVEGLQWIWMQPLLRTMALITAVNVFAGSGQTLIVIVISQAHHVSDSTIGLIFSIGGVGSILGSLGVSFVQKHFSFAQIIPGALWLYAVLWFALVTLPGPLLLSVIFAVLSFVSPFYNVVYVSYRLALTPEALQGRVNSVARLIAFGLAPLSVALTGILLQYAGPRTTIFLSVGIQLVLAVIATMNNTIRHARLLAEVRQNIE